MFCKSLATNHPRPCLRLLPVVAGLSQGRLDLSWTQFMHKQYPNLFSNLLHFVELLASTQSNLDLCSLNNFSNNDGSEYFRFVQKSALFHPEVIPYMYSLFI